MAEGIVLNLDGNLMSQLAAADKAIEKLGTTAESTEKKINSSFSKMADVDVLRLISALEEAKKKMAELGNASNFASLSIIGTNAAASVDGVNKLIAALSKLNDIGQNSKEKSGFESVTGTTAANEIAKKTYQALNREIKKMQKSMEKLKEAEENYGRSVHTVIDNLNRAREAQRKLNEEARNVARLDASTVARNAGTARTMNELRAAAKELKKTMDNLDPKSTEWKRLNEIYKETNRRIKEIQNSMRDVEHHHSNLMNTSDQLARKLALVFSVSAVSRYINKLIEVRGEFELQQRSLQAIIQDKNEADAIWEKTVQLAVQSPFRVGELVSYTKQLAAYRVETEKLFNTNKRLADVSAGLGVDMQRLILAFGQVKAANYLRGTELRQFSEAGINILGELSKYFTELEGHAVSVGEVFDRVSNRMVKFSDVEEIFKRITNEGGIFYNMQAIQAETLKGKISNLKDSIDLMFNEIGKANDGVLKDSVDIVKGLVTNWRMFAAVISEATAALLVVQGIKVFKTLKLTGDALKLASTEGDGVVKTVANLKKGFLSLAKIMKAHPLMSIASAVISAGYAMYSYADSVEQANKVYDEMSRREIERMDNLKKLNEQAEENNEIIRSNLRIIKKLDDANMDTSEAVAELNKYQKENSVILEELKTKYPDIYDAVVQQKEGYIKLSNAVELYNKRMTTMIALQQAAKGGLLFDSLEKNYAQAIEQMSLMKGMIDGVVSSTELMSAKLNNEVNEGKITEAISGELEPLLERLRDSRTYEDIVKNYGNLFNKLNSLRGEERTRPMYIFDDVEDAFKKLVKANQYYKTSLDDLNGNLKNMVPHIKTYILNTFDLTSKEGVKLASDAVEKFLESFGILDTDIKNWAKTEIEKTIGVKLVFGDKKKPLTRDDLKEQWQKDVYDTIKSLNDVAEVKIDLKVEDFYNKSKIEVQQWAKNLEKSTQAQIGKEVKGQKILDPKEVELNKKRLTLVTDILHVTDQLAESEKNRTDKGKDLTKVITDRIKVLRDMRTAYKKNEKDFDDLKNKEKILESFSEAFSEAFGSNRKIGDFDFTKDTGYAQFLMGMVEDAKRYGHKAELALQDEIGKVSASIGVDFQVTSRDDIKNKMDEMFNGYEISLQFDEMGVDKNLAEKFTRRKLFSLEEISELDKYYKDVLVTQKRYGEDGVKLYNDFQKRLNSSLNKQSEDRIKTYSKYLKEEVSDRINIEREAAKKISDIQNEQAFTPTMKTSMIGNVMEDMQKQIDSLDWKSFKESDLYIQMFSELEFVGTKSLEAIKDKLIEIRESTKNLSPTELKELQTQLAKIDDELIERNPFDGFGKKVKNGIKALKELKEQQKKALDAQKEEDNAKKNVDDLQRIVDERRKENSAIQNNINADKEDKDLVEFRLNYAESLLENAIKEYAVKKGITEEEAKKVLLMQQQVGEGQKTLNNIGSYGSMAIDSIKSLQSMLENWGVDFGEEFSGVLDGLGQVFGSLEQIDLMKPMSIIKGAVGILAGVGNSFASIFGAGNKDKKKERQIQRQTKLVEQLQKEYEKLGEKIENAYSLNEYESAYTMSRENIQNQIDATNKMIQLEEDKKKTDHERVEEYRKQIDEYNKMLKEIEEKRIQQLGGLGSDEEYKSAAEEFVDAWLSAYKETGDGLDGLEDKFSDFLNDMLKKQLVMRAAKKALDPIFAEMDKMFSEDSQGGGKVMKEELDNLREKWEETAPAFSETLKSIVDSLGFDFSKNGELSGLSEGIQSITEQTAQILESYMNSIRLFTADNNEKLKQLVNILSDDVNVNPMLAQLQIIARQAEATRKILESVVRGGHGLGGSGIKVFMD